MKKSSGLAQQVIKAQKAIEGWPDSLKSGLMLESSERFIARDAEENRNQPTHNKRRVITK